MLSLLFFNAVNIEHAPRERVHFLSKINYSPLMNPLIQYKFFFFEEGGGLLNIYANRTQK